MPSKRNAAPSAATKQRAKRTRQVTTEDAVLAQDQTIESAGTGVGSRTRSRNKQVTNRTGARRDRTPDSVPEAQPHPLLYLATMATESAASTNNSASSSSSGSPLAGHLTVAGDNSIPLSSIGDTGLSNHLAVNDVQPLSANNNSSSSGGGFVNNPYMATLPGANSTLGRPGAENGALPATCCPYCKQPMPSLRVSQQTPPPLLPVSSLPIPLLHIGRRLPRKPAMKFVYAIYK
ncbi:hypothetical protein IWW38_005022 [Coemansia aciculifera]|uniref:Uncharacterized protein n=1 Tax=Coemansia aciculifera TaxID=417176 RepID=A0ACC1LX32_9FUNG|nr:hypothetical protein IWW38_005022 [Coemansia aciculifera]